MTCQSETNSATVTSDKPATKNNYTVTSLHGNLVQLSRAHYIEGRIILK